MNIAIGPIKNKATWRAVVRKAQAMGYDWSGGEDGLEDEFWEKYKEYSFIMIENDITFCDKGWTKEKTYPIITPDKYLFGVDPGDKFIYHDKEVEYIGYDFKSSWNVLVKSEYSGSKWSKEEKESKKELMTNFPEIGTKVNWVDGWKYLEPIEEERIEIRDRVSYKLIIEERDHKKSSGAADVCGMALDLETGTLTIKGKIRENPYLKIKNLTSSDEQNKSEDKTMLQMLTTNALKKHLPGDIKKQYKAGFRDGDLELTNKGATVLIEEILADKYNDELTEKAEEIIKEHEEDEE